MGVGYEERKVLPICENLSIFIIFPPLSYFVYMVEETLERVSYVWRFID